MEKQCAVTKEAKLINVMRSIIANEFENAEWNGNSCSTLLSPYTVLISMVPISENSETLQLIVTYIKELNTRAVTTMRTSKLKNLDGKLELDTANSAMNDLNSYSIIGKYSIRWNLPVLYQYSLSLCIEKPIDKKNLMSIISAGKEKAEYGYNFLKKKI